MRKLLLALAFLGLLSPAQAQNYTATAGSGLTFGAKSVTSVLYPQWVLCDPTTPSQCAAVSAGGVLSVGGAVTNAGTFATQSAITAASASIASGAYASGAFASGAFASGSIGSGAMVDLGAIADAAATAGSTGTLSAKLRLMTTQLGTINTTLGTPMQATGGTIAPSTLAAWGLVASTQNGATPTNAQLAMGQFNTTPTTITSGNISPFQLDNAGNLLVNVKAGGGSGGTSSTFGSTFPSTGTAIGLTNGTNMVGWSATTNYGTAPSAIAVPAVNAFITNTNANGSAVSASSSPVVIASDQAAVAVKAASGAIASGAIASGAIASGAAVSGAFVAGSIADLAHGQGTMAASVPVAIASDQTALKTAGAVNQTPTDCSGSITTGGTAQTAISAQTTLHGFTIANVDTAHGDEVLWVSFTTTAAASTAQSFPLPPPTATTFAGFGSFTTPPGFGTNHAVSIIGATTSHVFSCTWW